MILKIGKYFKNIGVTFIFLSLLVNLFLVKSSWASQRILNCDFEDTHWNDYFFERVYTKYNQSTWDEFGAEFLRSTNAHLGNYSATANMLDHPYADMGVLSDYGNTDNINFSTHFSDTKQYYQKWYMMVPSSGPEWTGENKIIYMNHQGLSQSQFVVALHYNGNGNWHLTILDNNGYIVTLNAWISTVDVQDDNWHKIEVFMDWSLQDNGCSYTCVGLNCTAMDNSGIFRIWVDDILEYENANVVYKMQASLPGTHPIERVSSPANHSGDTSVNPETLYIDDVEIWDGLPSEENDFISPSSPSGLSVM